jgi:hypothetical protein
MKRALKSRSGRAAAVALAVGGLLAPAAAAVAAFSGSTTTAPATLTSAGSYGANRSWPAYEIHDASNGTETTPADSLSDVDGAYFQTSPGFPAAFDIDRHVDFAFNAPLQPGLAVTSPQFEMHFASEGAFSTWLYVQVYRRSTMTLLAETPVGTPYLAGPGDTTIVQVPLDAEVASSDIANDLLVRAVVQNDDAGPNDGLRIDKATFTGTTPAGAFSLDRESVSDTAGGGAAVVRPWPLVAVDGTEYSSATSWTTAFASSRYVRYVFPSPVPAGTPVTSAKLRHAFGPSGGGQVCYFANVYSRSGTLLGSHGSAANPYSCNTSGAVQQDEILLPELLGSDAVNGFQVRFYWRTNAGSYESQTDQLTVETTY